MADVEQLEHVSVTGDGGHELFDLGIVLHFVISL